MSFAIWRCAATRRQSIDTSRRWASGMKAVTKYAKSGDIHVAYQVFGDGPSDLVIAPGAFSHLELSWEEPSFARSMERLASFARVIAFDKRGQGLSDRGVATPTLEERMDDVRAVMDAAGSERTAILGISEGGALACLFAASNPARTSALILFGTRPRWSQAPDYPTGIPAETASALISALESNWGSGVAVERFAPSRANDQAFREWWGKLERMSASPADIVALYKMIFEIDVRHVLPAIRVPTLVLHRKHDKVISLAEGRYMAERISGAKLVELDGSDHLPWSAGTEELIDEIEELLTGTRRASEPDRILTTVLFVDIVGSTDEAVRLGDHRWRDLVERYYAVVQRQLTRFGGREIGKAGDGIFANFDGPARAVRSAMAIREAVGALGIRVRAGVHTGECEIIGDNLGGIAVHIGARVCEVAAPDEVLVSSTVKDLVAGAGLRFDDRGPHALKGVPEQWRLFSAS
jgi:pimeloyl-ACP methyl ester carboxylesterase